MQNGSEGAKMAGNLSRGFRSVSWVWGPLGMPWVGEKPSSSGLPALSPSALAFDVGSFDAGSRVATNTAAENTQRLPEVQWLYSAPTERGHRFNPWSPGCVELRSHKL